MAWVRPRKQRPSEYGIQSTVNGRRRQGFSQVTEKSSTFGERLERCLRERGWSRNRLATELGTSPGRVKDWAENVNLPDGKNLVRIARVLDVNAHWLLFGEGSPARPPADGESAYAAGVAYAVQKMLETIANLRCATSPAAVEGAIERGLEDAAALDEYRHAEGVPRREEEERRSGTGP